MELCCADVMALFQTAVGHDEPQAHFLDYVFERHPEQAKRTFHKAWLCAGRVFTRGLGAMEMTEDGVSGQMGGAVIRRQSSRKALWRLCRVDEQEGRASVAHPPPVRSGSGAAYCG